MSASASGRDRFPWERDWRTPGAYLAAFKQTPDQLSVVFFGHDQKMNVHGYPGGCLARACSGEPSADRTSRRCLAAIEQVSGLTCVHFIGNDRKLTIHWETGGAPWEGPLAISSQALAPPGGGVALVKQESDLTTALFLGDTASFMPSGPSALFPRRRSLAAEPATSLARRAANRNEAARRLTVTLFGGPTNEIQVVWGQRGEHGNVRRIIPEMVKLIPTWSEGAYYPYMIREGERSWYLDSNATSTGAFITRQAYVFAYESEGVGRSTSHARAVRAKPRLSTWFLFLF